MVAPVTGPTTVVIQRQANQPHHTNVAVGYRSRTSSRQKRPYNLDLPFQYVDRQVLSWSIFAGNPGLYSGTYDRMDYGRTPGVVPTDSLNRALGDFREKISSGAAWGVTLAERKQAMGMMVNRVQQLTDFVRALKRFRIEDAMGHLGIIGRPPETLRAKLKRRSSALGNNILEFRFGWQPLWQDIHNTVDILQSDIKSGRVIGKGHARLNTIQDASDPYNYYGHVRRTEDTQTRVHSKVWADVVMSNPNLALANNLGLANPALVAYELIPWSFVLNYFVSLEEFLSNFNPYAGYTLGNKGYTVYQVSKRSTKQEMMKYGSYQGNYAVFQSQTVVCTRTVNSIPSYTLRVRDPWVLKPGRALNAVGLLLQQFGKR